MSRRRWAEIPKKLGGVTRFEVIDHRTEDEFRRPRGRVYSVNPCRVEFSFQDDGKTLKVFVDDPE